MSESTTQPPDPTDRVTTLERELAQLREQYDQSQQTITALERRQRIDALLAESDPVDLEAARLLTEVAVASMDEPDLAEAVDDLRRHKPYLFRQRPAEPSAAQAPRLPEEQGDPALTAHEQAQQSGDRRDLLRYLRLRRQA
jgi:capsule polysaccharide export protein KpsE/RkpR